MKQAINSNGDLIEVTNSTPTRLINGIRYILTTEETTEYDQKILDEDQRKQDYLTNIKYKDDRKKGYGSIDDQLDMMYWDKINGTTTWVDHVAAVKATHPKP